MIDVVLLLLDLLGDSGNGGAETNGNSSPTVIVNP